MDDICFEHVELYRGQDHVLEGVDGVINAGTIVCLFGPSGCGKTTLLEVILGILHPKQGLVRIGTVLAADYREPIAYVPQGNELFRWLSVEGNVTLLHNESKKRSSTATALQPNEALQQVCLEDARQKLPGELSGGMARRAALARCLATNAKILLLDEAFVSVERSLRRILMVGIRNYIKDRGLTAIIVSHDLEEAVFMADRVFLMSHPPSRMTRDIVVNLPEHRDERVFGSDLFTQITLELIRE